MAAAYKRSSQYGWLWVVVVFLGIGISLAIGFNTPKNAAWYVILPVFGAPIIAAIGLCVWFTIRMNRHRIRAIQADVERDNFILDPDPPAERKASVLAPIAALQPRLDLRNGAPGIVWLALNTNGPTDTCIFEHTHVTGSGRSTQEHFHTVIAWIHPGDGPTPNFGGLATYRPHRLQARHVRSRHTDPVTTNDPRFDKQWITFGDPATVKSFLNDAVRITLADSPRGESWHVGQHWVACAFDGALTAPNLDRFRRRAQEIIKRFTAANAPR